MKLAIWKKHTFTENLACFWGLLFVTCLDSVANTINYHLSKLELIMQSIPSKYIT